MNKNYSSSKVLDYITSLEEKFTKVTIEKSPVRSCKNRMEVGILLFTFFSFLTIYIALFNRDIVKVAIGVYILMSFYSIYLISSSIFMMQKISILCGKMISTGIDDVISKITRVTDKNIPESVRRSNVELIKTLSYYDWVIGLDDMYVVGMTKYILEQIHYLFMIVEETSIYITTILYLSAEDITEEEKRNNVTNILNIKINEISNLIKLLGAFDVDKFANLMQESDADNIFVDKDKTNRALRNMKTDMSILIPSVNKLKSIFEDYLETFNNTMINDASTNRFFNLIETQWLPCFKIDKKTNTLLIVRDIA